MLTKPASLDKTLLVETKGDENVPAEGEMVDVASATAQVVIRHVKELCDLLQLIQITSTPKNHLHQPQLKKEANPAPSAGRTSINRITVLGKPVGSAEVKDMVHASVRRVLQLYAKKKASSIPTSASCSWISSILKIQGLKPIQASLA